MHLKGIYQFLNQSKINLRWFYYKIILNMNDQSNENKLLEGEDFYFTAEGYKCFTEKHHLKRGYCCKSGCRHCPYGFNSKTGTIKK